MVNCIGWVLLLQFSDCIVWMSHVNVKPMSRCPDHSTVQIMVSIPRMARDSGCYRARGHAALPNDFDMLRLKIRPKLHVPGMKSTVCRIFQHGSGQSVV